MTPARPAGPPHVRADRRTGALLGATGRLLGRPDGSDAVVQHAPAVRPERVVHGAQSRCQRGQRSVPAPRERPGDAVDHLLDVGQLRRARRHACRPARRIPYCSAPTGSWLGCPGTRVTNGLLVACIASVDPNDTWSTSTSSGSRSAHNAAMRIANRPRVPQQVAVAVECLQPDRGERSVAGRIDERADRRAVGDEAGVRARTEAQVPPLEPVGFDPVAQAGPGRDDDTCPAGGRRTGEDRERPVVRGVLGADHEQLHGSATGGRGRPGARPSSSPSTAPRSSGGRTWRGPVDRRARKARADGRREIAIGIEEYARLAVADVSGRAARARCDHDKTGGERLQHGETELLLPRSVHIDAAARPAAGPAASPRRPIRRATSACGRPPSRTSPRRRSSSTGTRRSMAASTGRSTADAAARSPPTITSVQPVCRADASAHARTIRSMPLTGCRRPTLTSSGRSRRSSGIAAARSASTSERRDCEPRSVASAASARRISPTSIPSATTAERCPPRHRWSADMSASSASACGKWAIRSDSRASRSTRRARNQTCDSVARRTTASLSAPPRTRRAASTLCGSGARLKQVVIPEADAVAAPANVPASAIRRWSRSTPPPDAIVCAMPRSLWARAPTGPRPTAPGDPRRRRQAWRTTFRRRRRPQAFAARR